jgi:hypothetical protein
MPGQRALLVALGLTAAAGLTLAQSSDTFDAHLSWVPISLAEQRDVGGQGAVMATLSRSRLSIEGRFEGLPAPATAARLHQSTATGASGPAFAELEIPRTVAGRFEGDIELDRGQRTALVAGHIYIQLHAERGVAPDNAVLRGWLLAPRVLDKRRRER